jgi:hypothetical protein
MVSKVSVHNHLTPSFLGLQGMWVERSRERGCISLQGPDPSALTSSHEAPLPKGFTSSRQHHGRRPSPWGKAWDPDHSGVFVVVLALTDSSGSGFLAEVWHSSYLVFPSECSFLLLEVHSFFVIL